MGREIVAVYQDCVLCGVKGRRKVADYAKQGIIIRKVGFTTEEGRELCYQAVQKGIGYMPFYVLDGDFAESIDALIPTEPRGETIEAYIPEEKIGKYTKATIGIKEPVETSKKTFTKKKKLKKKEEKSNGNVTES